MFKLTIQGDGLNFDMEINQTIAVTVIRTAMSGKFGPSEQQSTRSATQGIQLDSNSSAEHSETKSAASPEESEPP